MIVSIKIEGQISCEYICGKIQEAINTYKKHSPDLSGALITIDIKKIEQEVSLVPKLEYKM